MVKSINNLVLDAPNQPTEAEVLTTEKECKYLQSRIDLTIDYSAPPYLLTVDEQGMLPKGNIVTLRSKEKGGKTTAIAVLAAAFLKGELWNRFRSNCDDCKVMIIDTEQDAVDVCLQNKKILQIAGFETANMYDKLEMLSLRPYSVEERMERIEYAIMSRKPQMVFIDGLVDLLYDFNSIEQSKLLTDKLLKISSEHDCCILGVLHTNPSQEDGKMRGHIGTMAAQKASENYCVTCSSNGVFIFKAVSNRHKSIAPWSFMYDSNDCIISADNWAHQSEEEKKNAADATFDGYVVEYLEANDGKATKSDIVSYFKEKDLPGFRRNSVYAKLNAAAEDNRIPFDGKYFTLPNATMSFDGELPFGD